ncbi:hypothetical protein ACIQ7D_35910 [Streptomyces sp. NPDC096310]|uniref:hypothetical protein n=1 Tax=Streptomyces sp. NPDC096310 TaxID=3366082 RepID=UPI00382A32EE
MAGRAAAAARPLEAPAAPGAYASLWTSGSYSFEQGYRMGGFEPRRFLPPFRRRYGTEPEQHIGERNATE